MTTATTQSEPLVMPSPGDIVMVVNEGATPVTVMYDSRVYRLTPSTPVPMPFEAAILWFGDPRATESIHSIRDERGIVSYVPDRESEVRRLRVKYDNQLGDERVIVNHPLVAVYTVPGNNRLPMVLDDPRGEQVIAAQSTVQQEADLRALVGRQQKQIELLMTIANNAQQLGHPPVNPGSIGTEQGPSSQYPQPASGPEPMSPPPVPGVPSTPPPTLPADLAAQIVQEFPQDGETLDLTEQADGMTEQVDEPPAEYDPAAESSVPLDDSSSDLPQDGDYTPSTPPPTPPSTPDGTSYGNGE